MVQHLKRTRGVLQRGNAPYPGENWNRVKYYKNMGFDALLDQEFYERAVKELRNYINDEADYQKLIQVGVSQRKILRMISCLSSM